MGCVVESGNLVLRRIKSKCSWKKRRPSRLGIAPNIHRQVELRKAKRAAAPDNLAEENKIPVILAVILTLLKVARCFTMLTVLQKSRK